MYSFLKKELNDEIKAIKNDFDLYIVFCWKLILLVLYFDIFSLFTSRSYRHFFFDWVACRVNPCAMVFILPRVSQLGKIFFPQSPKWYLHRHEWEARP